MAAAHEALKGESLGGEIWDGFWLLFWLGRDGDEMDAMGGKGRKCESESWSMLVRREWGKDSRGFVAEWEGM